MDGASAPQSPCSPPDPQQRIAELFAQGVARLGKGEHEAAVAAFQQIVALDPECAPAHLNLGYLLEQRGALAEAEAAYRRALAADPRLPEAPFTLGNLLFRGRRLEEAAALFAQAAALRPDYAEAWLNLGNVQRITHQLDAAEQTFLRVAQLRPNSAPAFINLGNVYRARREIPRAIAACQHALALAPDSPEANLNLGLLYLWQGDFLRGWPLTEHRWKLKHGNPLRALGVPRWTGAEPLAGKTILLHAEQGLGDTLQFARYVPLVVARGARVILEVQPPLRPLFADWPGPAAVLATGDPLPDFDYECPFLSLPGAFATTPATIPASPRYLTAPASHVPRWRDWLDVHARPAAPRIGVKWSGNPSFPVGLYRTIPADTFAALLAAFPGIDFVSLEKDLATEALDLRRTAPNLLIPEPALANFADTAALVAQLDLVISIDTSVVHLAGALGGLTWALLPYAADWRWPQEGSVSAWYPAMRLFRQPAIAAWPAVLAEVEGALRVFCETRAWTARPSPG